MTNLPEKKQGIITEASGSTTVHNPIFNYHPPQKAATAVKFIPSRGITNFVGREEELHTLHEKLHADKPVAISAVAGMGGIGKTELATQYARCHETDYPGGIYSINARDANIAAGIIEFVQLQMGLQVPQEMGGRAISLEEQVRWCWQNWQPPEGLVLVILDDVTDWESCEPYLPRQNRFRVLMTTRLRNLEPSLVEEIPLDVLSPEEAVQLLTDLVGEKRVQKNHQSAQKLCEWLGYLPLGIQLVGAYLRNDPDLSLLEILDRLKGESIDDEALNQKHKGVKAVFELTWQQLNDSTQGVAEYLSLFAPDIIPWKYVETENLAALITEADIKAAKKQLYKHHLIQPVEEVEGCFDTPLAKAEGIL